MRLQGFFFCSQKAGLVWCSVHISNPFTMSAFGSIAQTQRTSTPSIASAATALSAAPHRLGWRIQNLGQNALFVRMGESGSSSVFDVVLAAGTANDNGTGGSYEQVGPMVYTGPVTIAGTSPRYVATEFYEV